MAGAIGPGDWIELIGPLGGAPALAAAKAGGYRIVGAYELGMVTVCEAVTPQMQLPDGRIVPGLRTKHVKAFHGEREVWLPAYQWRLIYRPRADIIESLKAPSPSVELEDA